jgi:hypothetical protein
MLRASSAGLVRPLADQETRHDHLLPVSTLSGCRVTITIVSRSAAIATFISMETLP